MKDANISNQEASSDEKRSLEGMIHRLEQMDCLKKRLEHVVEVGMCFEGHQNGGPKEVVKCVERVNELLNTISSIRRHYIQEIINVGTDPNEVLRKVMA